MSTLRGLAVPIGAVAAVLLILLFKPWFIVEGDIRTVLTVAWISFIVLLVALFEDRKAADAEEVEIEGPAFVRFPLLQLAGGPVLAADPPLRRFRLAGRRHLDELTRHRV